MTKYPKSYNLVRFLHLLLMIPIRFSITSLFTPIFETSMKNRIASSQSLALREFRMWATLIYRKAFTIKVIIPSCTWNSKKGTEKIGYNQIPITAKEVFSTILQNSPQLAITSNIYPLKWYSGHLSLHSWRSQLQTLWPNFLHMLPIHS